MAIITSGLVCRIRADQISGLADGANITSLNNEISGKNDGTAVATNYAQYQSNINGLPAIHCDGNAHYSLGNILSALTEGEVFIALKRTVANNDVNIGSNWNPVGVSGIYYTHSNLNLYEDFGRSTGRITQANAVDLQQWCLYNIGSALNDWDMNLNGANINHQAINAVSFPNPLYLFANDAGLYKQKAYIREIVIYDRKLTPTERTTNQEYFRDQYQIANLGYVAPVDLLLPAENLELYVEAEQESYSDNTNYSTMVDYSGNSRDLVLDGATAPKYKTNQLNSKSGILFNGSSNPLNNAEAFYVACGWMVVKFNDAGLDVNDEFDYYQGLLSDLASNGILVSDNNGVEFFDYNHDDYFYEFRSNDRIYPASAAPAPMDEFKIIFFRFWTPFPFFGVQIGQNQGATGSKADCVITLLALYSKGFCEPDIRTHTQTLATFYGLSLADVLPLQANSNITPIGGGTFNTYKAPEGDVIAEEIEGDKFEATLSFDDRPQAHVKTFMDFHKAHFPEIPFIYRDYSLIPPRDYKGNFTTNYQRSGDANNSSFSAGFREK